MTRGARSKPPTTKTRSVDEVKGLGQYGTALLDIGWRLLVTVVIFLAGGSWLDRRLDTKPYFTLAGFLLTIASFVLIVRQILRTIPRSQGGLKDE